MQDNEYRLNVGLIVANKDGELLLCKRKGMNSWQFPQGGIDFGEDSLKAANRELFEEVGISSKSVSSAPPTYQKPVIKQMRPPATKENQLNPLPCLIIVGNSVKIPAPTIKP